MFSILFIIPIAAIRSAARGSTLREMLSPVLPLLALSAYFSAVTMSAQSSAMDMTGYSLDLQAHQHVPVL